MSKKEKTKKSTGLPRMASRRRKERTAAEEKAAEINGDRKSPVAARVLPKAEPLKAPGLTRPDPLADFVKSEETKAQKAKVPAAACQHKHLAFTKMGAVIRCIDCPRQYHVMMEGGHVPDVGYFNAALSDLETRHTPYEAPRITRETQSN